jgi:sterol desaturase/sphingolipid hydroxylase (fatty acid hydroxylase superfamily)
MAGLGRWKTPTVLALLFAVIAALYVVLHALHPIAQRIEDGLLAAAASSTSARGIAAIVSYNLWISTKALVLPAIVIGMTFFVEMKLTEAERERKNYLLAALVQVSFFYVAFIATRLMVEAIPLAGVPLLRLPKHAGPVESTLLTIALVGLYLFLFDVLFYWTHRAHHHVQLLWKFHAIHHCTRDLDALHNYVHPVELFLRYFTIALPLAFIIHLNWLEFYPVLAFLALQNQLNHMNVPLNFGILGKVFVDNRFHFIHHSSDPRHFNQNYAAIFSFTDRIFGTFHPPEQVLPKTGFSREQVPSRLSDFILARKAAGQSPSASVPQPRLSKPAL